MKQPKFRARKSIWTVFRTVGSTRGVPEVGGQGSSERTAHPLFDGDFPRLPDELADGDDASNAHAAHQDDEDATDVCEAELVGGARAFQSLVLNKLLNKKKIEINLV